MHRLSDSAVLRVSYCVPHPTSTTDLLHSAIQTNVFVSTKSFVPDKDLHGRNIIRCSYLLRESSSTQLSYIMYSQSIMSHILSLPATRSRAPDEQVMLQTGHSTNIRIYMYILHNRVVMISDTYVQL